MEEFDPLSYKNLGASIAAALDRQPLIRLDQIEPFTGAGIYALFYSGDFSAYSRMAKANQEMPGTWPIYIGRAEAENSRKGIAATVANASAPGSKKLFNRIRNHRNSIEAANNIRVEDFWVRFLVIMPTWIPLAEIVALNRNKPLWNVAIDGLGNHDPGAGRHKSESSRWDTLHPGRPFAERLLPRRESSQALEEQAIEYLTVRASHYSKSSTAETILESGLTEQLFPLPEDE